MQVIDDEPKLRRGPPPTGPTPLTRAQEAATLRMRAEGFGYCPISRRLHVSTRRVKAFLSGEGIGPLPPRLAMRDNPEWDDEILEQYSEGVPFPDMADNIGISLGVIKNRVVEMRREGRITISRRAPTATGTGGRVEIISEQPRIIGDESAFAAVRFHDDERSMRPMARRTPQGTAVSVIHSSASWAI